jgi:flagellar hook-length control protein FliK
MNTVSIIPAPVTAEISGVGSFFGSCQMAANNFEPFFQSAIADNTISTAQGISAGEQSNMNSLKNFSDVLGEYGENKMLEHLQKILGKEAGMEAFELTLKVAQNEDILKQLSPEEQRDVWRLFKIMDMEENSFNNNMSLEIKGWLENWLEKIKDIFGDAKIEFKQPEELTSEFEEEPQKKEVSKKDVFVAMSYEDLENTRLLATEMEIKSEDVPKFEALINSLMRNGLLTSQDLNSVRGEPILSEDLEDTKKIETTPIRECIEELWKLVENETETEIKSLVNENVASLMDEKVIGSVKEETASLTDEKAIGSAKEETSSLTGEKAIGSAKEETSSLADKKVIGSVKEEATSLADEKVIGSVKEEAISLADKKAVGSIKEEVANLADEKIIDSAKERISDLDKEKIFGSVKEETVDLSDKKVLDSVENSQKPEKVELVKMFLDLLLKKKNKSSGEENSENSENEYAIEEEEEPDLETENKISMEDVKKEKQDLEEKDEYFKLLNSLLDTKKAEKNKHKTFKPETQLASQTLQSQQTLQIQPQQMRQPPQVQPEVRAIWEGGELKIEVINPKTGEKLQDIPTNGNMQRTQERMNEFEVVRQVVAQAKFITTPTGEQRLTMHLRPEHLGQLDLRIILNHGEMQIYARVESATAQQALENHIGLLREGLEKQGIALDRLEISIEQREKQDSWSLAEKQEQEQHERHGNRRHNQHNRELHLAVSAGGENTDTGRRLGYNTMEYLA